jgi:hypothetical protein
LFAPTIYGIFELPIPGTRKITIFITEISGCMELGISPG